VKALFRAEVDSHAGLAVPITAAIIAPRLPQAVELLDERNGFALMPPRSWSGNRTMSEEKSCRLQLPSHGRRFRNGEFDFSPTTATTRCRSMAMWWRRR